MQNSIYQSYIDSISDSLKNGKKRGSINKSQINESVSGFDGITTKPPWFDKAKDEMQFESLQPLNAITGKKAKYDQKLGAHPDFNEVKEQNTTVNNQIVSMFIDIKNSTGLFKKYDPYTVAAITTTIQQAAIHTCWYFDGYIQRLQGDGLLVYFGGKNIPLTTSVNNAINASSFISYFVKYDLKRLFEEQGVERIYTRIGIDAGYDPDVLWHLAGIGECSEITTCSLHTSLASKMQSNATSNGVIVGDHIIDNAEVTTDFFTIKNYKHDGKEERYIFQIPEESFHYSQWEFNWEKYLRKNPSITSDDDGTLYFTPQGRPVIQVTQPNLDYLEKQSQQIRPYGPDR